MNPDQQQTSQPTSQKKAGSIIVISAIIIILIIGAIYIFAKQLRYDDAAGDTSYQNTEIESVPVQAVTSTSDDLSDIQADLDISIEGLDSQNF